MAVTYEHVDVLKILLKAGANPNYRDQEVMHIQYCIWCLNWNPARAGLLLFTVSSLVSCFFRLWGQGSHYNAYGGVHGGTIHYR